MSYYRGCLIGMFFLFAHIADSRAQGHFVTPTYTPHFTPIFHSPTYYNYYGTVSLKHKFRIVFKDGTDTIVNSMMHTDTPTYYLLLENKAVKKKDSARFRKILPSTTQYIVRLDSYSVSRDKNLPIESKGTPTDSCWLFKAIDGKISAYTALAEDNVDDGFLLYIQKDDGPLVHLNSKNLQDMVGSDEKAARQAEKGHYTKAIKAFNKSTD